MKVKNLKVGSIEMEKNVQVHPSSMIGNNVRLGEGTRIWQFCNVMDNVRVGSNCNIGQNVYLEEGVVIGNNVKIKNNVSIYKGVTCENDVFLGPACVFTNVIHPRSFIERKNEFRTTLIKMGATIGANATIICGHTIGKYAMIGAGTVLVRDAKDYELIIGNPGKHNGFVCKCGESLMESEQLFKCKSCHCEYIISNNNMVNSEGLRNNGVY